MVGINLEMKTHKLKVNSEYPHVRQKWKNFIHEQNRIINEEIEKLKQNRFIKEVYYPRLACQCHGGAKEKWQVAGLY